MTKKQKKLIETIEKELSGMTCCDIVDYIVNRKEDKEGEAHEQD